MKCYKCGQEMYPIEDTAWRTHHTGEKQRVTEFMCAECRVYAVVEIVDYSESYLIGDEE